MQVNEHGRSVSVVGLGYVGIQIAVAFGEKWPVVGFDIDPARIGDLKVGFDRSREVSAEVLSQAKITYTTDPGDLSKADFHIITVPTPIDASRQPVLDHLLAASTTVGAQLSMGDIVVFESTVYPGATEEVCVPALERSSGLRNGVDFFVGYSPERVNPGDRQHGLRSVAKVVAAQDSQTLDIVASVYGSVVKADIHRAPSIRVAEAAKVIENTQRDLNIALMNELALIFHKLDIDTGDVLAAAGTKWNFLPFTPGLVGGHCVGVDPYYLTHRAKLAGYDPQMILAGRSLNDNMGHVIADELIKTMIIEGYAVRGSTVTILGLTFKEDVPDTRNSRVPDIVTDLEELGVRVQVHDPVADASHAQSEHGIKLLDKVELVPADALVLAVAHRQFVESGWSGVSELVVNERGIVIDVKRVLNRDNVPPGLRLWRL